VSAYNWRIGHGAGRRNLIAANPQRLESADGLRWACGRNVKRSLGNRRYDGVEVWTLKHRVAGKVVTVAQHRDRSEAEAWINYSEVKA